MPRKRPVAQRLAEVEQKAEDLRLEKSIEDMKAKRALRRPKRRRKV